MTRHYLADLIWDLLCSSIQAAAGAGISSQKTQTAGHPQASLYLCPFVASSCGFCLGAQGFWGGYPEKEHQVEAVPPFPTSPGWYAHHFSPIPVIRNESLWPVLYKGREFPCHLLVGVFKECEDMCKPSHKSRLDP